MAHVAIDCGENGSLSAAAGLAERMREAFRGEGDIVLDVSRVANPDISLIQLVEAARKQAAADGRSLSLSAAAGPILSDILEKSGILWAREAADLQFWLHEGDPS